MKALCPIILVALGAAVVAPLVMRALHRRAAPAEGPGNGSPAPAAAASQVHEDLTALPVPPPPMAAEPAATQDDWRFPEAWKPPWTRITTRRVYESNVEVLRGGKWINVTAFGQPQAIHDYGVSADSRWLFVWHCDRPPRLLSIYDLRTLARTTRITPGFGGSILWTSHNTLLHSWGCGTNCRMWRIYDARGKTLTERFTTGLSVCPSVRFMVTGPSLYAAGESIRLIELGAGNVLGERKVENIVCIDRVDWSDARQVTVPYLHLAVRDDRDSEREGEVRFPLPQD